MGLEELQLSSSKFPIFLQFCTCILLLLLTYFLHEKSRVMGSVFEILAHVLRAS